MEIDLYGPILNTIFSVGFSTGFRYFLCGRNQDMNWRNYYVIREMTMIIITMFNLVETPDVFYIGMFLIMSSCSDERMMNEERLMIPGEFAGLVAKGCFVVLFVAYDYEKFIESWLYTFVGISFMGIQRRPRLWYMIDVISINSLFKGYDKAPLLFILTDFVRWFSNRLRRIE